jgi:hypothetical protein
MLMRLARVLPVPVGTATLTGRLPNVVQGPFFQLGVGTLGIVGLTPALNDTVPLTTGSLSLSGQFPAVNGAIVLATGAGSLNATGLPPALFTVVAASTGSLTVVGLAPNLSTVVQLGGNGAIVFGGHTITLAGSLTTNVGALTLTMQAPRLDTRFVQDVGVVGLTGLPLLSTFVTSVPAGSLNLVGRAPLGGVGIIPGAGSLNLVGRAPFAKLPIISDPASITLMGQFPSTGVISLITIIEVVGEYVTRIDIVGEMEDTI